MELKSSDEKLARETISESGIREPGNPISGLFHGRRGKRRGAVFSGLLCSLIRDAAQRQRKDDGNAKGKACRLREQSNDSFVIVRIKTIDIAAEEETSARRAGFRRKEPARRGAA